MRGGGSVRWLAWLLMPAAAILALSSLSLPRQPYTGLLLQSDRAAGVDPGSPAARAGIAPGDRVWPAGPAAAGHPGRLAPLAEAAPGIPLLLERERAGRSPDRVWLLPQPLPAAERRMMAALLAMASGFVLLAGLVWSERRDRLTRTFFLLCLAFACLILPAPRWPWAYGAVIWRGVYSGITLFLPALFVHFFALFPGSDWGRGRTPGIVRVAYVVATLLFAASLLEFFLPANPAGPRGALDLLQDVAAIWFAAGLVLALALFVRSYRRARTSDARRRLRVALAGTVLGAGPLAALILVRNLSPGTVIPGERWAVLLTLLVPASFAWAIAVHRIFDFGIALRAGAVALGLALLGAASWLGGEWIAHHRSAQLGAQIEGISLAVIAVISAVLGPLGSWLRGLHARLPRAPGAASLAAWVPGDPLPGGDAEARILSAACRALHEELRLDGCSAIRLGAGAAASPVRAGAIEPPALEPAALASLAREGGVHAADDPRVEPAAARALELAGVRWVLPVGRTPVRAWLLLGRRLAGTWLSLLETRELERFAQHVEVALENAALRREASVRGALDRELEEAHAIQAHLLPRRAPIYPTLDCAAAALSSESVGGDYYDFVETSARDFTLAVGDAAGKGVPAALVLAGVQARFRDEARRLASPGTLLGALNRALVGLDQPEKFMGLLCARVEVRAGRVWFANAGLTPPLIRRRSGGFEEPTAGGVLLGVSRDATYPDVCVELSAGDLVVLYTDGLTEARRGDELYGSERVRSVLEGCAGRRAADVLESLLASVRSFADQPLDDLTVVVLRQLTRPARARATRPENGLKLHPAGADTAR